MIYFLKRLHAMYTHNSFVIEFMYVNCLKLFDLLGYCRIVLALIAFWCMSTNYIVAGWCYAISALLDAVDGHAARAFNQSK